MANLQSSSLEEAINSIHRRPGIVFGPGVTRVPGMMQQVLLRSFKAVADLPGFASPPGEDKYRTALDALKEQNSEKAILVEREIEEGIQGMKASLDLPHLSKAGWSACISLTEDILFESALRNHLDSIPSSRTVTIVDHPSVIPPERTTPVYKLLGNINNRDLEHSLALSESSLLVRQQSWNTLLRTCPDYLREAPLFLVGTAETIALVRTVLSTLLALPRPSVTKLLFLKGDPTLIDPTVRALCSQCNTVVIDATLRDLCASIADLKSDRHISISSVLSVPESDPLAKALAPHQGLVSVVPSKKPEGFDTSRHLAELIDGLFRPASVDWRPFLVGLDLRRTAANQLKKSVLDLLQSPQTTGLQYVVVHGEAGIGKTTLLKRVATELSAAGVTILWCNRAHTGNWIRNYRSLATDLSRLAKEGQKKSKHQFVLICDDPHALRLDAGELMTCFDRFSGRIIFIFSVRNSDYYTADGSALTIGAVPSSELEVPFELDEQEIKELSSMLQRVGAVKDEAEAKKEIARIPSRHASDILCSLWYLIPETRSQLTESLRDEYCRLGEMSESIARVAQHAAALSAVAHRAYEFVTVTSNLDIGIPIEVLVRALRINYDEWLEMTVNGRPLWGLLYDTQDPENGSVVFRTRNEVVTRVLLDLVNGGVGHVGEVRVLKELLRSCDVGSPVYRNFVLDVLVRSRAKLAKILMYEQGLELFDIARQTLPHSDRVLEHHKGIWMDDIGHDHKNAYSQLEHALQCPVYPGSERDTPQEHIHTSMASSVVRMVRQGTQDKSTGLELVREHLRQASSPTFFNPHTAHVSANILYELAQHGKGQPTDDVSLVSYSEALQEIEKAFQLVGTHGRIAFKFEKTIVMLGDLQRKILKAIPSVEQLRQVAEEQFSKTRSQTGFEVLARRLLAEAIESGKGRDYNEANQYLQKSIQTIQAKQKPPSPELLAARVDLVIRWRIQRPGGSVDWKAFLDDLQKVQTSPRYKDDVIKRFYLAVALFHCRKLTDANAIFASLRRMHAFSLEPGEPRCYYLGAEGHPQRFQGTIERQHGRYYIEIPELDLSVPARSPTSEGGPGSTVHAYIGFTLNGPLAIFDKPKGVSI